MYQRYIKRPMDFILSLCTIVLLIPVLLIVAILVRFRLGSPVIFKQQRPGRNDEIFTLYKFRTMNDQRDKNRELLSDEIRLTKFGKLLRSTSIDELPELVNILKGDMSFVGPRPLLVQYLPLYSVHQKRRQEVRPGLTGLAQISGRNSICWEDKFNFDVKYVENITFIGDWKIIFSTIKKVFIREGINSKNVETMELFTGTNLDSKKHKTEG